MAMPISLFSLISKTFKNAITMPSSASTKNEDSPTKAIE